MGRGLASVAQALADSGLVLLGAGEDGQTPKL